VKTIKIGEETERYIEKWYSRKRPKV